MKSKILIASGLALLTSVAAMAQLPVPLNQIPSRIVGHPPEPLQLVAFIAGAAPTVTAHGVSLRSVLAGRADVTTPSVPIDVRN